MFQRIIRRNRVILEFYDNYVLQDICKKSKVIGEIDLVFLQQKVRDMERDIRCGIEREGYDFLKYLSGKLRSTDCYEVYK